jgi:hypothetical protein
MKKSRSQESEARSQKEEWENRFDSFFSTGFWLLLFFIIPR